MNAIMIVLTVVLGIDSTAAQTATVTTMATCQQAQKQLNGKDTIEGTVSNGIRSANIRVERKVDCIPVKP